MTCPPLYLSNRTRGIYRHPHPRETPFPSRNGPLFARGLHCIPSPSLISKSIWAARYRLGCNCNIGVIQRDCGSFAYSIAFTLLTKYSVSPNQLVGTPTCCS